MSKCNLFTFFLGQSEQVPVFLHPSSYNFVSMRLPTQNSDTDSQFRKNTRELLKMYYQINYQFSIKEVDGKIIFIINISCCKMSVKCH